MTTTEPQSSPSSDGDIPERIEPLTGSLSANTGQQLLVKRLAEVRAVKKALADEETILRDEVREAMLAASAATLTGENGVTIARITMFDSTKVDGKKLEVLHPEIFEECSKTTQVIQVRTA